MVDRPVSSETIRLTVQDGTFSCYAAYPNGAAAGSVIVLQEIFGLTPFVRGACAWLASHGFAAIAPDLFWRQSADIVLEEKDRDRATALMKGLDQDLAIKDCAAVINHIQSSPTLENRNVAALGYCLGGKLAYVLGLQAPINAVVSYYGVGIQGLLTPLSAVRIPVLLHLALEDALCPPAAQEAIQSTLGALPNVRIESYPAGHAFARTGSAVYNADCAAAANSRTITFLRETF
jgi:carboxymethylenebutenolidase